MSLDILNSQKPYRRNKTNSKEIAKPTIGGFQFPPLALPKPAKKIVIMKASKVVTNIICGTFNDLIANLPRR